MSPKARVQKRLYYKIGEACKALEIQPYVLRYWETEFAALSPSKSRSGQRVYSEKEMGVIRRIKELLYVEGYTIAGAKKKLEAELASGLVPETGEEAEPDRETPPTAEAAGATPPETLPRPGQGLVNHFAPDLQQASLPAGELALRGEQRPLTLDTRATERVESMRQGITQALHEAREILALLDPRSPSRR